MAKRVWVVRDDDGYQIVANPRIPFLCKNDIDGSWQTGDGSGQRWLDELCASVVRALGVTLKPYECFELHGSW